MYKSQISIQKQTRTDETLLTFFGRFFEPITAMFLRENQSVVCYVGFLVVKKSRKSLLPLPLSDRRRGGGGGGKSGDGARGVARNGTAHHDPLVLVEANSELQTAGLSPVCDCERTRSKPTLRSGARACAARSFNVKAACLLCSSALHSSTE